MDLSRMRTHGEEDVVDVVVVGTGAGGAPLLASLAARGMRVVALEAGENRTPEDHAPEETLASADINWMDERLSAGSDPTSFGPNNSGRGVGGSTLHWGAFTPRPDARDLRLRTETGLGRDWPVDPGELTDYVLRVEHEIGVSGPARYPWDPSRRYEQPPALRNAPADIMVRGCERLGIDAADAPAAVLTRDRHQPSWGTRQACVNCGACHQGCRNTAKASMDTTYLPAAVADGAEIRPGCTVHTIELDARGQVEAVVYRQDGQDHRQRCRTLVLAAGGVETPRLLLHAGLANGSGHVGRHFLAHGATQVWARFDGEVRGHRGYPSSIITEDFVRPDDVSFAGGYLIQSLGVMPQTFATTLTRGGGLWGSSLVEALRDYPRMSGLGINGECLPSDSNALVLSDEVDAIGVPKARITFSSGPNEEAIKAHAVDVMTRILEAAGGTDVRVLDRTAHTIGTCRMGTDPGDSVVDPWGRSHEIPNLWISDNSTFPSALTANPALTIMALALRTADRMASSEARVALQA
ncbi:GMC family oxidoreductase [Cnuibacter physcomitrellae]|uniref:GMC family oxidoreductase n=1 Tax=Cnuibacter physcomitrellae TaxID=1619308 RepID=UPI002175C8B6|nr:GMC family oxidoreductase [Cnuibacter physcomitrellae]MCS5497152.1 GMC family oxidoreductase [Cnuibacter physcomitrellae]